MKSPKSTRSLFRIALLATTIGLVGAATLSQAQPAYPSKPVRLVIPFPAGGAVDTFARIIGPELQAQLGQPIVILNKPGGGSQIAAADVLSSPADGYAIFVGQTGDFTVNPLLYKNITYIPSRDFDGISMLVRAPQVMLANVSGKISSLQTLKDQLSTPGSDILYGSMGPGTAPHLLGHMLSRNATSVKFTHVPYKGFPPAMQAILTKEIDLLFDAVPGALGMMRTGKVVPIAVADTRRNSNLPNVPTTAEIGYPSLLMDFWIGAAVKKGTPRPIINQIHQALEKAVANPENWKKFSDLGYGRVTMSPEQFDSYVRSETDKMKPVIVETGVSIE